MKTLPKCQFWKKKKKKKVIVKQQKTSIQMLIFVCLSKYIVFVSMRFWLWTARSAAMIFFVFCEFKIAPISLLLKMHSRGIDVVKTASYARQYLYVGHVHSLSRSSRDSVPRWGFMWEFHRPLPVTLGSGQNCRATRTAERDVIFLPRNLASSPWNAGYPWTNQCRVQFFLR